MLSPHFRYRKVTPRMLAQMQALRKKGLTYREIGAKLGVAHFTVQYHLSPTVRIKAFERAKRSNKKQRANGYYEKPTVKARRKRYNREYMRDRYQNDPEFRRKMIRANSGGKFADA